MAKKKEDTKKDIADILSTMREGIASTVKRKIPDIMTFVNDPDWLGLGLDLYPIQQIALKCFYRGSQGNENLELNQAELNLLERLGCNSPDKGDVLGKYESGEIFKDLVLVWGRRSGKDFVTSIIALYEAMKLLECEGGDPYKMYELGDANTINIITIANSQEQAKLAFAEMRAKLLKSRYFKDKFHSDGFTANSIYLLTPADKIENIDRKEKKLPRKKGSIGLVVGHSNSDSLLGMGCIVLLLDEVATYKNADRIYQAMMPTIATYNRREYVRDANDNFIYDEFGQREVHKTHYDGKLISISSPRGKEGKFYEFYKNAPNTANRLMMRLATWEVTPQRRKELRKEFSAMTEGEFNMEFGAEFSGIGLENFFSEDQVNSCFTGHNCNLVEMGRPGNVYFAHFDPATSSHNYALVVLHKEFFMNPQTKKSDFIVVVDHVKYWHP